MSESPVALFVPSEIQPRSTPTPLALPALPQSQAAHGLLVATARIDHSGRVGDQRLLHVLSWQPGNHYDVHTAGDRAAITLSPTGRYRIDSRLHVFLPAATRTLLQIRTGDQTVLVASPQTDQLIIHSATVIADLLAHYYASHPGVHSGH